MKERLLKSQEVEQETETVASDVLHLAITLAIQLEPNIIGDYKAIAEVVSENLRKLITERDIYIYYESTVDEESEDLILQNRIYSYGY